MTDGYDLSLLMDSVNAAIARSVYTLHVFTFAVKPRASTIDFLEFLTRIGLIYF